MFGAAVGLVEFHLELFKLLPWRLEAVGKDEEEGEKEEKPHLGGECLQEVGRWVGDKS